MASDVNEPAAATLPGPTGPQPAGDGLPTPPRVSREAPEPGLSEAAPRMTSGPDREPLWLVSHRAQLLAGLALIALAAGGALSAAGAAAGATVVWGAAVAVAAAELAGEVIHTLVSDRSLGVDTIALVAMAGALALGQELAGVVIALMFSGGASLETVASRRARRELAALVQRMPTVAQVRIDDELREVPLDSVRPGDVVVIRTGEVVPVDGTVLSPESVVDTSTLSGESLPETLRQGAPVLSGVANAGPPFELRAERAASESAYAALVRLVEMAQGQRAPFVRMANRYAGIFLPATLLIAGVAWALSGAAVRALSVVVVATPCPLILAAPIALVSGLSRTARAGIVVKGAGVIEALGNARTVLFDKTGTLTAGTPNVREIVPCGSHGANSVLQLAASLDQLSAHVLASGLVAACADADLALTLPVDVHEEPGQGISGNVDGHHVLVGSRAFMAASGIPQGELAAARAASTRGSGEAHVLVGIDGRLAATIVMADELRPEAQRAVERLREEGIRHLAMLSGDRRSVAERVGQELALDRVYSEQSPEDKLQVVRAIAADPLLRPVIMVGDGINDAPALAAADIGIALGAAGATVSSETADAVITVDRIDRVADGVHAGRRALHIARQSVLAGMGLSAAAMVVAAAGYLPPVEGALLQEVIDLAVILNALRALSG